MLFGRQFIINVSQQFFETARIYFREYKILIRIIIAEQMLSTSVYWLGKQQVRVISVLSAGDERCSALWVTYVCAQVPGGEPADGAAGRRAPTAAPRGPVSICRFPLLPLLPLLPLHPLYMYLN